MERQKITKTERYEILNKHGWKCVKCGKQLKYSKNSPFDYEVAHIDHIIPVNIEQETKLINNEFNLEPLCPKCNREKWDNIDPNYILIKIYEKLFFLHEDIELIWAILKYKTDNKELIK